jgi:hypothetical protein
MDALADDFRALQEETVVKRFLKMLIPERTRHLLRSIQANAPTQIRYKTVFLARRMAGHRGTLYFSPAQTPPHGSAIYKLCHELGLTMAHGINSPAIFWPTSELPYRHARLDLINGTCIDIDKTTVVRLFVEAFGYNYSVDPRSCQGPYVRKSNINGMHDGVVFRQPSPPESEYVYQRLINNSVGNGTVEDLRLIYIDGLLDFAYCKVRPISDRFSNTNKSASLVSTSDIMSADEHKRVSRLCAGIGLQYGELDVLRDRDDRCLYVVDVNRTPWGPPNGLPLKESRKAVKAMATAFKEAFL